MRDRIFYGWVIVAAIIASSFVMVGINSSFGVFFKSFEGEFGLSRAATSAVLSGRMAFSTVFAYMGGWAVDRYGPRIVFSVMGFCIGLSLILTSQANAAWQLFITYSLLLAIGVGGSYVVTASTLLRWFHKKRGLALGIAGSGGGLGTAIIAPFGAFLIEGFEWRTALLILGGIAWLIMLPFAQLMRKDPHEIGAMPDGATADVRTAPVREDTPPPPKVPLTETLQTRGFWYFMFIWVFLSFSSFFVTTHIVPHATDLGFSPVQSATILSLTGVSLIAGRLVTGLVVTQVSTRAIALVLSLVQAGALLSLVWAQELWMLYLFGLVHGFAQGGFSIATTVLIGETFSLDNIGKVLGLLEIGIFVGAATGPLIGGLIFDASNSYGTAFVIMAATIIMRTFLVALNRAGMKSDGKR